MNTFFTQFKKEAEKIRLTKTERHAMYMRLEEAMRTHHFSEGGSGVRYPSPYFSYVAARFMVPLTFLLIVAIVGGGTAYAAEASVPGDLLYPIKIGVTEPLRGSLAFSNEAKLAWHAESALRRLEEAETLAARGTLTPEATTELEQNLDQHVSQATAIADIISEKDPVIAASVSVHLATSLGAHSAVISRLGSGSEDSTTRKESGDFAEHVNVYERTLARADVARSSGRGGGTQEIVALKTSATMAAPVARVVSEEEGRDLAIAIALEENASTTLAAAETELDSVKANLTSTTTSEIKNQISGVRAQIKRARTKRQNGDNTSAKQDTTRALRDAAILQAFLEAQGKFHERILPRVLNANVVLDGTQTASESVQNKDAHTDEKIQRENILPGETPTIPLQF